MKKLLSLGILALSLLCPFQVSAAPMVLKVTHTSPITSPQHQAFVIFKELVEKNSNGSLKVDIYENLRYGNVTSQVQGLQMGILAMCSDSTSSLSPWAPRLAAFDMPYIVKDLYDCEAVQKAMGKELTAQLDKVNGFLMGFSHVGFRYLFTNKPIKSLDQLKSLKIRTTTSKVELGYWKALGANPTPMLWGEAFTALQQGTVDGINIDAPFSIWGKIFEVCKYGLKTKISYYPQVVLFSKTIWKKLTPEQQKVIMDAWQVSHTWERLQLMTLEAKMEEELARRGIQLFEVSEADQKRMEEILYPIPDQFSDLVEKDVVARMRECVKADRARRTWW